MKRVVKVNMLSVAVIMGVQSMFSTLAFAQPAKGSSILESIKAYHSDGSLKDSQAAVEIVKKMSLADQKQLLEETLAALNDDRAKVESLLANISDKEERYAISISAYTTGVIGAVFSVPAFVGSTRDAMRNYKRWGWRSVDHYTKAGIISSGVVFVVGLALIGVGYSDGTIQEVSLNKSEIEELKDKISQMVLLVSSIQTSLALSEEAAAN